MSSNTKRPRRNGWLWAVGGSFVVHGALVVGAFRLASRAQAADVTDAVVVDIADPSTFALDGASRPPTEPLPDPPLPGVDEVLMGRPLDAPQGERDNAIPHTRAPREGETPVPQAPAPDSGDEAGRSGGPATRRDRSTLQSQVADSEDAARPSRMRLSRRSASPQAIRREKKTGIGDSVRTAVASRAPSAATSETPPGPEAMPDTEGPASGTKPAARAEPPLVQRTSATPSLESGAGPLAAEAGARMFDVDARGRATDDRSSRASSNAPRPGITDYSHAGVAAPADTLTGRGPGSAPGAVARATDGSAPSVYGARKPQELAADVAERTRERAYDRYRQEIQLRVKAALVFPRTLAIRLEQGEAVVTFVVKPDGTIGEGPRIVKSSGFQEFDAEACRAVLRAAPFPRRNEPNGMAMSMPVTFENPLIR
jgi:TonB family protein